MELKDLKPFYKMKNGDMVLNEYNVVENITNILKYAAGINNDNKTLTEKLKSYDYELKRLKSIISAMNNKIDQLEKDFDYFKYNGV